MHKEVVLFYCITSFLIGGFLPAMAIAENTKPPKDELIQQYARQPIMIGAQLSPDGTRIAFLSSLQGRYHLVIEQFEPEFTRDIVAPGEQLDFDWVRWASNDRLVFSSSFSARRTLTETTETRLFSVDANGNNMEAIIRPDTRVEAGSRAPKDLPPPQIQDDVIDWLTSDPDHILVSVDSDLDGADSVRQVDVNDGSYLKIMRDFKGIRNWVTDQTGEVRLGWGYDDGDLRIRLMDTDGHWSDKKKTHWWHGAFVPIAFTANPAVVFVRGPNEAGISVIRKLDLQTGEFLETVFEDDKVDASALVVDAMTGRPVGVSYTRDLPAIEYFDDSFRKLQATIDKYMPDTSNRIASTSADRRQILIFSYSDTNPGAYYLWNRDAKSLDHYSDSLPHLTEDMLSPVDAVSYAARDKWVIPAYLTVPKELDPVNLPAVILPHGGPHARDDKQFWFLSQYLVARGYAVLQPNFRGSSGYGSAYANAGKNEWGGKMQDDVTDGARWLVNEGIADPDRICIVGWSYGGYSAAIGAVKTPDLYRCAASINGVLNLARQIDEDIEYVGGSEWTRHVGLAGENAKVVSPYHQAEKISIPMLIIQAKDDTRVHEVQGRSMARKLRQLGKQVEYVEIEFGGHSMENEQARHVILKSLDSFLLQHIGTL
jgi:dipeptidyl aminopeptidase/acylaminoacyl peptidase